MPVDLLHHRDDDVLTTQPLQPVLSRLLPPLLALLLLVALGTGSLFWYQHRVHMNQRIASAHQEVVSHLQSALERQAEGLAMTLQTLVTDPRLQRALAEGDRAGLLSDWLPLFLGLRNQHQLTHFYFLNPQRICLLRVHQPDRHGDRIDRHTAQQAEQSGRIAWGLELGPMGTLTLRVVMPVQRDGQLLGYVELGKEIEDILSQLHLRSGHQVGVILHKQYLNRDGWDSGMQMLGRKPQWDRFPLSVMAYSSHDRLPEAFAQIAEHDEAGGHGQESEQEFRFDAKIWRLSVSLLHDVQNRPVGDLLVMTDITATQDEFHRTLQWALGGGLLALLALLGLVVLLLRRTDAGIVTLMHKVREALSGREASWRGLFNNADEAIYILEADGRFIDINPAAVAMYGQTREWLLGKTPADVSAPGHNDLERLQQQLAMVMAGEPQRFEFWGQRANGEAFPKEVYVTPSDYFGRRVMIAMARDTSERKQAEERLRMAASVFSHAREGIMITSPRGEVLDVNQAFTHITGYAREEIIGRNPSVLSSGLQESAFYQGMWTTLLEQGHWHGEIWNRRKSGELYPEMLTISAVQDQHGKVLRYVGMFSDITPFKEYQRQLERIAHYDALTGLPNRILLADRLQQAMVQVQRRGTMLAVVYLDLDGFKTVNDSHGHDVGDRLLNSIAVRMRQALREVDTIARLGGDEFVAVLLDLADQRACLPMLDRLLLATAEPVWIGGLELQVSASLGVTFYPQLDEIDPDQLLRQADQSMYQAKLAGKNRYHLFDTEHDRSVRGHHESLEQIRQALQARQFVLYYQPKVNMRSGEVVGAEALIRWQHPQLGVLPPAAFLPVIEGHSLIVDMGEWVLDAAMAQIEVWKQQGLQLPVSVNIDGLQLQSLGFVEQLHQRLQRHPSIGHGDLELEVLETSALADIQHVSEIMWACRDIGIDFALDDFGTGYSSLTYLKRLPAGLLKIDQSFVRDMLDDPEDLAILEGVLGLASAFRRRVIAEGVETLAHGEMLLRLGCELGQGYAIARPMPAEALPEWMACWRPDPCWQNSLPSSHNHLPVLFGIAEHRAWVAGIKAYLQDENDAPPPLDVHQCRLGRWLDSEGHSSFGQHAAFDLILRQHDRIHQRAKELLTLKLDGHHDQAREGLEGLCGLRDDLIEQLLKLLD